MNGIAFRFSCHLNFIFRLCKFKMLIWSEYFHLMNLFRISCNLHICLHKVFICILNRNCCYAFCRKSIQLAGYIKCLLNLTVKIFAAKCSMIRHLFCSLVRQIKFHHLLFFIHTKAACELCIEFSCHVMQCFPTTIVVNARPGCYRPVIIDLPVKRSHAAATVSAPVIHTAFDCDTL